MNNPYSPPAARVADQETELKDVVYAGFWVRLLASIIDGLIILAVSVPLLLGIYGTDYFVNPEGRMVQGAADFLISYVFPLVATVLFWKYRAATPGKMALGLKIVNADDLAPLTTPQAIGRYFAYLPAVLVLGIGLLWVAFDARKQGWHDKLAGTVVIRR
jgi:uncharacterized RDD family membrane protein YckC